MVRGNPGGFPMNTETTTMAEFIEAHGLTMEVVPAAANPNLADSEWEADHWSVTIKGSRGSITLPYSMGIGHRVWAKNARDAFHYGNFPGVQAHSVKPGERVPHMRPIVWENLKPYTRPTPPDLACVLDSLASDASSYENARNFDEWASEYGYDTDSRKAEKTYRSVGDQAKELLHLLGREVYEILVWKVERL